MRLSRISWCPWLFRTRADSPSPAPREREGPSPKGWGGEGLFGFEGAQDCFDHAIGVAEHVVVPKSDYFPALAFEQSRSACVHCIVAMLAAIDFDHQSVLGAGKIDNKLA